jgi:hypothetical protein
LAFFQPASEQGGADADLAGDAFRQLAESVHPLALGNVKRNIEQIWQLAKKLIRLHRPDLDDAALTTLVTRLTTELYSHSHLITRAEATALGLPVEQPSEAGGSPARVRRPAADRPRIAREVRSGRNRPATAPAAAASGEVPVVLERAYIETRTPAIRS